MSSDILMTYPRRHRKVCLTQISEVNWDDLALAGVQEKVPVGETFSAQCRGY